MTANDVKEITYKMPLITFFSVLELPEKNRKGGCNNPPLGTTRVKNPFLVYNKQEKEFEDKDLQFCPFHTMFNENRPKFVKNLDKTGNLELNLWELIISIDKVGVRYLFRGSPCSQYTFLMPRTLSLLF